jgi:hypothetical protein
MTDSADALGMLHGRRLGLRGADRHGAVTWLLRRRAPHMDKFPPALLLIAVYVAVRRAVERVSDAVAHRGEGYATLRHVHALDRSRRVLDQHDIVGYLTLDDIATDLVGRGRLHRARVVNSWAVAGLVRELGPRDPETLPALHHRAQLLWRTGDADAARMLAEQVLEVCRETFGAEDWHTAGALAGLGIVLADQGQLEAAERLQSQALDIRTAVVGREHRATFQSMVDLCMTQAQLRRPEVQDLADEIFKRRMVRGRHDPDLTRGRHNLDFGPALAADLKNFREGELLDAMVRTGDVPPRKKWDRVLFEM